MRAVTAAFMSASVLALGLIGSAPAASAATTWDFASGSFTLNDGLGSTASTASLAITNMQVTGSSATGTVELTNGRYTCTTRSFSGLTATFANGGQYDPCSGTVTFAVDGNGVLTVASSSVYIPTTLLTSPASGSAQGVQPPPTVVTLTDCTLTYDDATRQLTLTSTADTDQVVYDYAFSGSANEVATNLPATSPPNTPEVIGWPLDLLSITPSPTLSFTVGITARAANGVTGTCSATTTVPGLVAPTIDGTVPVSAGGLLTVNYSVTPSPVLVGIEYQIDGGPWLRPGGTAPVNGAGGTFTISGITAKSVTITLRSVGTAETGPAAVVGTPKAVAFPGGTAQKPPVTSSTATGSTPKAPIAAPPAQPTSTVSGTSNGAGTGTNGALAASTGDAGIDAPCLAEDGTLYPTLYSTVGSQLTMAPNTRGMGSVKSFTVVGGALPAGMQMDRQFGVLYGVTTQAGSWATTVRATLADGTKKDGQFTTRVDADPQTLQYAAQNIGSVGAGISIAPSTNAPVTGTTYKLVCGELPTGTKFDAATGRILGTPKTVVARPVPLRVAETSSTGKAAASFIFVVNKAGTHHLSYPGHPHARPGKRITIRPTVSGVGDIAEFRTSRGKLPKGLHLNHQTGVITGRVAHAGRTHTITMVAETKGGALLTAAPMKLSLKR